MSTEDKMFQAITENKVEKSLRNTKAFHDAIKRAEKGDYDEDITTSNKRNLLKVAEKWTIRKAFSITSGEHYYKLYKEVFYLNDPQKKYFDTVEPTVYRRIAAQKEHGNYEWAKAVAEQLNATIVE